MIRCCSGVAFLFHPSHLSTCGTCLHPSRCYMPLNAWSPVTAYELPTACEDITCNISTSLQGVGLRWANRLTKATKPPLEHYDSLPEPALNEWPGVLSHCSDGRLSETDNWAFDVLFLLLLDFITIDCLNTRYYFWTAFLLLQHTRAIILYIWLLATLITKNGSPANLLPKLSRRNEQLFSQN